MEPATHHFTASDGVDLAWHEVGEGRAVVLLHGLFSSADMNWIRFGHAAEIASRGFRVIMPDLRAHGESAAPHDEASYPPDILARDGLELIAHLGLKDYDLGGYSLGARTSARMAIMSARPGRIQHVIDVDVVCRHPDAVIVEVERQVRPHRSEAHHAEFGLAHRPTMYPRSDIWVG